MRLKYVMQHPNNNMNEVTCIYNAMEDCSGGSENVTHEIAYVVHLYNRIILHPDSSIFTGLKIGVSFVYVNTIQSLKRIM